MKKKNKRQGPGSKTVPVVFPCSGFDRAMATPVARDASRRAVEQGEKEAPSPCSLSSPWFPSLALGFSLPILFPRDRTEP